MRRTPRVGQDASASIANAFAPAGWGNWVNTAVLALLLLVFGQTGPDTYQQEQLEMVRRTCSAAFCALLGDL